MLGRDVHRCRLPLANLEVPHSASLKSPSRLRMSGGTLTSMIGLNVENRAFFVYGFVFGSFICASGASRIDAFLGGMLMVAITSIAGVNQKRDRLMDHDTKVPPG